MSTKLMALCGVVVASACGARPYPRAGSALDPKNASAFWCSSTGQCFTEENECLDEACFRESFASCAVYQDGNETRYLCGVDDSTCMRFKEQLPLHDVGECITRAALALEPSTAVASQPIEPAVPPPVVQPAAQPLPPAPVVQAPPPVVVQPPPPVVQAPPPPPVVHAPPAPPVRATVAVRDYRIASSTIGDLEISAVPTGAAGWDLRVTNNGDTTVLVMWDESTFVSASHESGGRLIHGSPEKVDAQPATPVAPHSRITESVYVEKMLPLEEDEDEAADAETQKKITDMLVGGHMVLTLQAAGGKQTWSGLVANTNAPEKAPPPPAPAPAP